MFLSPLPGIVNAPCPLPKLKLIRDCSSKLIQYCNRVYIKADGIYCLGLGLHKFILVTSDGRKEDAPVGVGRPSPAVASKTAERIFPRRKPWDARVLIHSCALAVIGMRLQLCLVQRVH